MEDSGMITLDDISQERKDFESWLTEVKEEIAFMVNKEKDNTHLLSDYEISLMIIDELEDLAKGMVKEKEDITKEEVYQEAEVIYDETGHSLERYGAILFNFTGKDEDLIKKHMNFNIHESSIKKYYTGYVFQKRLSKNTSIYQAAIYCYYTFIDWLKKKVELT